MVFEIIKCRFEPDMLAFSGCYYGGGDKERNELAEIRKRWDTLPVRIWLTQHFDPNLTVSEWPNMQFSWISTMTSYRLLLLIYWLWSSNNQKIYFLYALAFKQSFVLCCSGIKPGWRANTREVPFDPTWGGFVAEGPWFRQYHTYLCRIWRNLWWRRNFETPQRALPKLLYEGNVSKWRVEIFSSLLFSLGCHWLHCLWWEWCLCHQ